MITTYNPTTALRQRLAMRKSWSRLESQLSARGRQKRVALNYVKKLERELVLAREQIEQLKTSGAHNV